MGENKDLIKVRSMAILQKKVSCVMEDERKRCPRLLPRESYFLL